MKLTLLVLTCLVGHFALAQSSSDNSINNKNYYDHFQDIKGHSINWLRSSDAIPVIIDELQKNGIAYHTISVGQLLKLNDTTRLVVTVSFKKGDKQFGFLYEATHGIPLNRKDRDFLTDKKKAFYVQAEKDITNGVDFMRVDPLPGNIFLLKQTCYWFQFDNNGTQYNVTKDAAKNVLRQDVSDYLKTL